MWCCWFDGMIRKTPNHKIGLIDDVLIRQGLSVFKDTLLIYPE